MDGGMAGWLVRGWVGGCSDVGGQLGAEMRRRVCGRLDGRVVGGMGRRMSG